jgi:rRNA maturation protein Nop10
MMSKIFRRENGSYTLVEIEDSVQNVSVIPQKYSVDDKYADQRRKAKEVSE